MLRKVLVVDDDQMNRELLCRILSADYEALQAQDGSEALGLLSSGGAIFSAVMLDLAMPIMDGYEVLTRMKEEPALTDIPVIVTTASGDAETEIRALSMGASDFIAKPYNPKIIRRRVWNAIRLHETSVIANAASLDKLTGLYNREGFFVKAAEMIGSHEPRYYVLSSLDINNFKVINDQYGISKGDEILKFIAEKITRRFEPHGGICARLSADNFAILYPCSFIVSEKKINLENLKFVLAGVQTPITISVGRYVVEDRSLSLSVMYDRAVIAKNKIKGRFDVHIAQYDESMREQILREQEIVNEMNGALKSGQFEAWFQPQYNHSSGALIGAEALVRWRHPQKGLVSPGLFIPVFERNGFIYELDKYVWEQVCALLRKWLDEGRSPLPVSVNVSRYDVFREDLIDQIVGLTKKYALPMELLRLEITESAFAQSPEQIIYVVESLIKLGFTVEIDDFGSGYSSLNTLKDVPAQVLKLDMKFFEGSRNTARGGNIVESIVRMAKWLGMSVIAEGVETAAQAEYLKSIGCCYVQGYLYARPMPVGDYETLAKRAGKEEKMLVLETVRNYDNTSFWDPQSMDTLIFNSYVGGSCIFEYQNGRIEALRANEKFVRMIGKAGAADLGELLKVVWEEHLDEENMQTLLAAVQKALESKDEISFEIMFRGLPGCAEKTYLRASLRVIASAGSRCLIYCTCENITAQRETEIKMLEADRQLRFLNSKIQNDNETLLTMMNDTPGGFVRIRYAADGRSAPVYVNDVFCSILSMAHDEVLKRFSSDIFNGVHPDDLATLKISAGQMLQFGKIRSCRYRLLDGRGEYIWMTFFGRATKNESGEVFMNLYFNDLSEQERKELAYRDMLPVALAALMEFSTDHVFVKDREFRYLCASRSVVQFMGLQSEADLVGKTDFELFPREFAEKVRAEDLKLISSGQPLIDSAQTRRNPDGSARYVSISKYLLFNAAGAVVGIYGVGRDVTKHREANSRLKLLTDSIPGGLATYMCSSDGLRLLYFNDGFCRMLGYSREEYAELAAADPLGRTFREDVPLINAQLQKVLSGGDTVDCVYRIHKKNGGRIWVHLRGTPSERLGAGAVVNAVLFDVTEQKEREERQQLEEKKSVFGK